MATTERATTERAQSTPIRLADRRVAWTEVSGEVLILDLISSMYYQLNEAGSLLWEHVAAASGPVTAGQLGEVLMERFGISEAQAAADVELFLGHLNAMSLLET
jgi:Coenzyme PQQ synthesis protein D (PqqD)